MVAGAQAANVAPPLVAQDVLILVNGDSPVSRSIANLYRSYYDEITDQQVLYLYGLPDAASLTGTPDDEIITREEFETLIAQPTRDYLIATDRVDATYCIITTAGMPYRIRDTDPNFAEVVCPPGQSGCQWGSNGQLAVSNRATIDAATVESELSVLFQIDPALPQRLPIKGRLVNPYQGYASGIKAWAAERDILGRRQSLRDTYMWRVNRSPRIEGVFDGGGYVSRDRIMSPADIYLVARLDGPRNQGEYPIFAVMEMLNRAAAVSDPASPRFVGYNPEMAVAVIDHAGAAAPDLFSRSAVYNFPPVPGYDGYAMTHAAFPVPPGAEVTSPGFRQDDHYELAWKWLTETEPTSGSTELGAVVFGLGGTAAWDHTTTIMSSAQLPAGSGVIGLLTYGRNGGDGRPEDYLLSSGPGGGPLVECVPGAVFHSLESFNAVTMFTDTVRLHALLSEFIAIGGSAAVGHAFEPERGALIQGDYLLSNYLRDDDGDGVGDLSLVEAVFTAMPYLSWSEVLIGDPLMRLHHGPGGVVQPVNPCTADADGDGYVGYTDLMRVLVAYDTWIGGLLYHPAADITRDGHVGYGDLLAVTAEYGKPCPDGE